MVAWKACRKKTAVMVTGAQIMPHILEVIKSICVFLSFPKAYVFSFLPPWLCGRLVERRQLSKRKKIGQGHR